MKKLLIAIAVITILIVFSLNAIKEANIAMLTVVDEFFAYTVAGDFVAAAEFATNDIMAETELLKVLANPKVFERADPTESRLVGLQNGVVEAEAQIGGSTYTLSIELERELGVWKISAFPRLLWLPVAYVMESKDNQVSLLTDNGEIVHLKPEIHPEPIRSGDIGMVIGINDQLVYFQAFTMLPDNRVLIITDEVLEGEKTGFLPFSSDSVYFRPGPDGMKLVEAREMIVGMNGITFYVWENEIRAVLLPEEFIPRTIRIALNTTGFGGTAHSTARVSSDNDYFLEEKVTGERVNIRAGRPLTFSPDGDLIIVTFADGTKKSFHNRLYLYTEESGYITIQTLRRGDPAFTPSYRGHMEIRAVNGQLYIVNETTLEEYLYSVVPSEMPVSFGLEPLKVQSIAARSYAVASIYRSGFRRIAAHVDDSIASQVYNNMQEQAISNRAVNETAGIIAAYGSDVVDARFFSTSAGMTANFHEVWHDPASGEFPAQPIPYLQARRQVWNDTLPDVTTENGAKQFIADLHWNAYDYNSPWFRWQVEMTREELEATIKKNLAARQKAQPDFVLTKTDSGFISMEIPDNPLGKLLDFRVIRRGEGGNIMELEIVGENGTYMLVKEYTIRFTVRPTKVGTGRDIILLRHDGSRLNNYTILPSTFLTFDIRRDNTGNITSIHFNGGGNGHGVGMSQWGAKGLADNGNSYTEIITHYYPGIELKRLYKP
ncbi:MAG: SpoIID/LytB domain-containing protein [Clostridiales bacterium]|jgi:SpoIID/LytB domain protein|nr:SpoIID/LytB domain-containing protein [Clostridiales bacterium]